MKLLVSACLLGVPCRFDGAARPNAAVMALAKEHELIPICPECYGGLPIPRVPSERRGEGVIAQSGADVTAQYRRGAAAALRLATLLGAEAAILKERSPSCGHGLIYDGSFTHTLVPGDGVTAELLLAHGIPVLGESQLDQLPSLSSRAVQPTTRSSQVD